MENQHRNSQPQSLSIAPIGSGGGHGYGGHGCCGRIMPPTINEIQEEIMCIKQDSQEVRGAVLLLEMEKDTLRMAVRKLKLSNVRLNQKVKKLQQSMNGLKGTEDDDDDTVPEITKEYDELGRNFYLLGGIRDPFSLEFEVDILGSDGIKHRSSERYYWYKMAETFNDSESMDKILKAPTASFAENVTKEIKGFDEAAWNKVKLQIWEQSQRLKFEQIRWIACVLVLTETTYLAYAVQDKYFGTGWRKNREESNKPIFWDGENEGGKVLMKIRQELKAKHTWNTPKEEEECRNRFLELKRNVWRRFIPSQIMPFNGNISPTNRGRAVYGNGYHSNGRGSGYSIGNIRRPTSGFHARGGYIGRGGYYITD